MKRNLDLLRAILLLCENEWEPGEYIRPTPELLRGFGTVDQAIVNEHIQLLGDADFIEYKSHMSSRPFYIERVTNAGYDFLMATRDPTFWEDIRPIVEQYPLGKISTVIYDHLLKRIK